MRLSPGRLSASAGIQPPRLSQHNGLPEIAPPRFPEVLVGFEIQTFTAGKALRGIACQGECGCSDDLYDSHRESTCCACAIHLDFAVVDLRLFARRGPARRPIGYGHS
jgi:hypothetical protein